MTDNKVIWKRKMKGIKVAAFAMAAASAAVLGIRFSQPQASPAKAALSDYEVSSSPLMDSLERKSQLVAGFVTNSYEKQADHVIAQDVMAKEESSPAALPQSEGSVPEAIALEEEEEADPQPAQTDPVALAPSPAPAAQEQAALPNEPTPASAAVTTPSQPETVQTVQNIQQIPEPVVIQSSSQEMAFTKAETEPAAPAVHDDGIWHIQYVDVQGAGSAPADGSIGKFADGWFIMHSGMANGEKLKTMPEYVEVDGQTYHLTDAWMSGDGISEDEIARIRANNGITFQTCIDDATNQMVHYDPVDGPGYPYHFENYPYTYNDGVIFGYGG